MILRHAALLVLLAAAVVCMTAAQADAVLRASETLCRSDPLCAVRWFGGVSPSAAQSSERFDEMFAQALARGMDGGFGMVDVLQTCVLAQNCTVETQLLWLALLRQAEVCGVNEEWVYGHGCACQDGKECEIDCAQAYISDLWSVAIGVGFVLMLVLAVTVWEARNDTLISRRLDNVDRQITALHVAQMQAVRPQL